VPATMTSSIMTRHKLRLQQQLESLQSALSKVTVAGIAKRRARYMAEVHDRGEESNADAEAEIDSAIGVSHSEELARVREALQRIENGVYGVCEDCGGAIGEDRLDANPCARRCIECQTDHERIDC